MSIPTRAKRPGPSAVRHVRALRNLAPVLLWDCLAAGRIEYCCCFLFSWATAANFCAREGLVRHQHAAASWMLNEAPQAAAVRAHNTIARQVPASCERESIKNNNLIDVMCMADENCLHSTYASKTAASAPVLITHAGVTGRNPYACHPYISIRRAYRSYTSRQFRWSWRCDRVSTQRERGERVHARRQQLATQSKV